MKTTPKKTYLPLSIIVLLCALLGGTSSFAERTRSTEAVTFSSKSMALTIAPDGKVSLTRNGKVVSAPDSSGWSVYNWTSGKSMKDGTRTALDNMAKAGANELLLWSSKGPFEVKVAITAKDRYFTFELLHVSNDPQTGGLNKDWPGHRVDFDLKTAAQDDGWQLNTVRLNPMSELASRWNYKIANGAFFSWPYPQWAQTKDRPQPQGMVAVFGFANDREHDDILADIWVAEPSLPRPNRANLKSWTRKDVDAWLDRCEKYLGTPLSTLSFSPVKETDQGRGWEFDPDSLFPAADLAAQGGMNSIYMSQHHWQDDNIGKLNPGVFPGGREQGIAWRKHCDELGIRLQFHGFSHLIRKPDPDYGWGVVHPDLAKSARGTLLQDVPAEAEGLTILVEPDLAFMPGMKKGMLPFYDINNMPIPRDYNGGLGGTFPPYYEGMASLISLNKNLYRYTAEVTPDNKWKIVLAKGRWACASKTPLVKHKKGDTVEFILTNANGNYFLPDSRSDLLVQQAIGYAQLLNDMQTCDGYDGSAWTEDLGSWGLRRFSQEVYERMDHPGGGGSALGIILFGHFEHNFKRIQNAGCGKGGHLPIFLATESMHAPSYDVLCKGVSGGIIRSIADGEKPNGIGMRAIHSGLTLDIIRGYGLWEDAGALITKWRALTPHISKEQAEQMIEGMKDGSFYVASEAEGHWQLTKKLAMLREGIDSYYNVQPERPPIEPRQFFKVNGEALTGLKNPYTPQKPEIDIHVMASMSNKSTENVSLMPAKDKIINPKGAEQTLSFENGHLIVAYDNSKASKPYEYYARNATVGHWERPTDMTKSRGIAITLKGDGSGSTLVLATDGFPRYYAVDVDFGGERTIEIPSGDACNNREGWNIFKAGSISQFDYSKVGSFRLFLHKVAAGKKAKIEILNIRTMNENRNTGLIDPVLTLNAAKAVVKGTIPYNHYLVYSGGASAKVYGPNWKFVKDLPVTAEGDLKAVKGSNTFSVSSAQSPNAWLSSRIKVADTENRIIIQKPKGTR